MRPVTHNWNPHEKATFWKYRYWLRGEQHVWGPVREAGRVTLRVQALPKFVQIVDWEDREEVDMIGDILLSWDRPSVWTCLELMATEGPATARDIDLLWAAAFSRSLYQISFEMAECLLPCLLGYFARIATMQDFFPGDDSAVATPTSPAAGEGPKKAAINLLAELLVDRALEWPAFGQSLFWNLKIRSKEISAQQREAGGGAQGRDNIYARLLGVLLQRLQSVGKPSGQPVRQQNDARLIPGGLAKRAPV